MEKFSVGQTVTFGFNSKKTITKIVSVNSKSIQGYLYFVGPKGGTFKAIVSNDGSISRI